MIPGSTATQKPVRQTLAKHLGFLLFGVMLGAPAAARADVVLDWNAIAAQTALTTSPFNQARVMAIVHLAVFEAVNTIEGGYERYLDDPLMVSPGASAEAAAVGAAHRVLVVVFPAAVATLDTARDTSLAAIPDGPAEAAGVALGIAAADAMLALRAADGWSPNTFYMPSSTLAGSWQTTPSCPAAGGQFFQWQDVTPFAISGPSDYLLPAPPALTSNGYAKDYAEVQAVGGQASTARPAERAEVARLYAGASPSFALSMATRQIAAAKGLTLSENARALALIMMGISDSLVASFYNKYHYTYWRPETAIHAGAADGNGKTDGDTTFAPFITTPCFPSYPSSHASGSSAGLEVMRRLVRRRRARFHRVLHRAAGPGHVDHQALLAAEAGVGRCGRRPRLWRHPLSVRPGCGQRPRTPDRDRCLQVRPASGAGESVARGQTAAGASMPAHRFMVLSSTRPHAFRYTNNCVR